MLFSDDKKEWRQIPDWVEFLVQFGYQWNNSSSQQRRIAIVSMPCDSAAAGLISLGALIRDFENPNSNDIDGHFNSLLKYAQQYLESCRYCDSCNPEEKGCGFTAKATGWVRNWRSDKPKRYKISEHTNLKEKRLLYNVRNGTWWQNPDYSTDWQIDGEPPPHLTNGEGLLSSDPYKKIISGVQIDPSNLQRSYSGLCFAGRVSGKTATRRVGSATRFRLDGNEFCVPDLLTINGWPRAGSVSRMSFFNSRTECFDRYSSSPYLVIADGDKSFLKLFGRTEFQRSDVIGVINRIIEHIDLEAIGNRLNELRQWYTDDFEMLDNLPSVPRGIGVMILKRRTA